jgi:hypothetical protein
MPRLVVQRIDMGLPHVHYQATMKIPSLRIACVLSVVSLCLSPSVLSAMEIEVSDGAVAEIAVDLVNTEINFNLDSDGSSGGGTLRVNAGGTLTQNGWTTLYITNIYGQGVVQNEGAIVQNGSWPTYCYAALNNTNGAVVSSLNNGIFLSGGGTHAVGSVLNSTSSGTVFLSGGTHVFNGGSLTGSGYTTTSGGTTTLNANLDASAGGFRLTGGTVNGTASLNADRLDLQSGAIDGGVTLRLVSGGEGMKSSQSSIEFQNGGTLRVDGTFDHDDGSFNLDAAGGEGGGTIANYGTWNVNGSANLTYSNTYASGQFLNEGIFNHTSTGYTNMYGVFNNTGTLNVESGGLYLSSGGTHGSSSVFNPTGGNVVFSGGAHVVDGGSFTGNGYVVTSGGTTTFSGNVDASTGGYSIQGGTVNGTGTVTAQRLLLDNGYLSGSVVLVVSNSGSKTQPYSVNFTNGGTLRNNGTFTHSDGSFDLDHESGAGAGTIENNGTWEMNATGNVTYANTHSGGVFANTGTFDHTGTVITNMYAVFNNTGTVNAEAGGMYLYAGGTHGSSSVFNLTSGGVYFSGGTHTLNGGSFTGSGNVVTSGGTTTLAADVNATSGGYTLLGGTINGTGTLSAHRLTLSNGSIDGSVVLRCTGTGSKSSDQTVNFNNGGTLRNSGTFTHSNGGFDLDYSGSAGSGTIENSNTWQTSGSLVSYTGTYGGGVFTNSGMLSVGTSSMTRFYIPLTNSGTISVNTGTLLLDDGSTHTGHLNVNATLQLGSGTHILTGASALLTGSGTIIGTLGIQDGATLSAGNSPGTLSIDGTLNFSTSGEAPVFFAEIEGTAAGEYDVLRINSGGTVNLGSGITLLDIDLASVLRIGDDFSILNAMGGSGTYTGYFSNLEDSGDTLAAIYGTSSYTFTITYNPLSVDLEVTDITVVPEAFSFGFISGLSILGFVAFRKYQRLSRYP